MKLVGMVRSVLLSLMLFSCAQLSLVAALPAGKVVWWGHDEFWEYNKPTDYTNGVIEFDGEIVSNVTAIAATMGQALLLREDGTVFRAGRDFYSGSDVPAGLSNVVSIAFEGKSCWAIRRDGTVVRWGNDDIDPANLIEKLTNVVSLAWVGPQNNYIALQKDRSVLDLDLNDVSFSAQRVYRVEISQQPLAEVASITTFGDFSPPAILKKNGEVYLLDRLGPDPVTGRRDDPALIPIRVGAETLTNILALAAANDHNLALKRDGTVLAWGRNQEPTVIPPGLSNVVAIAAGVTQSLALKSDGTVVAWGDNYYGQRSVPAGLSNVVAIASGGDFNLAITTGNIPPSVRITPHGRLEIMERESDLVIKGKALSSQSVTNKAFPDWGAPVATKMAVISVLKGNPTTNEITFLHLTHGPGAWGGGSPPPDFSLKDGLSYLIFAKTADKPEWLYSPAPDFSAAPNAYRQLMEKGDVPIRTLDDRPLDTTSVKEAHWRELNLLLHSAEPTNQLYAIEQLDALSLPHRGERDWRHSEDFRRTNLFKALVPFVTSSNAQVASRAIDCFGMDKDATALLEPFTPTLIGVANESSSVGLRIQAIAALSGTHFDAISNSLVKLLHDGSDKIRSRAIALLDLYPGDFAEKELRRGAEDQSAKVRAGAADVIGDLKDENLVPVLAQLFKDPVGREKPISPLTIDELEGGGHIVGVEGGVTMVDDPNYPGANVGDVHTSTGYALLKFDVNQVAGVLKTNLNDPGFRLQFILKLAGTNVGPWLDDLTAVMEKRHERNVQKARALKVSPDFYNTLSGAHYTCWNLIYSYLEQQPAAEFRPAKIGGARFDRYLNMLEQAGSTGSQKRVSLYHLYRVKGLTERAARMRQKYPDDKVYFDQADKQP